MTKRQTFNWPETVSLWFPKRNVLQAGASGSQVHLPLPLFPNPNQPYRALSSIGGRLNDPTVGGQLAFHFQPFYIHTRNELVVSVR